MKLRILVTGGGGQVAQGVLYGLENTDLDIDIYLGGNDPYSIELHNRNNSILMCNVADERYVGDLIGIINKYKIDVLIPTIDSEILKIAHAKNEIERNTGCKVLVGNIDAVEITSDKEKTIHFLKEYGFSHPLTETLGQGGFESFLAKSGFPCIIKSRFGNASKEVYLVKSKKEALRWIGNSDYLIQELLDPNEGEFTTGIYTDKHGVTIGSCTLKRSLVNGGTQIGERVIDSVLEEPLLRMAKSLGLSYLNIQSMKVGGILVPFEFNGRFSGTTGMISGVFNGPELYIREHVLNQRLKPVINSHKFFVSRGSYFGFFGQEQVDSLKTNI